MTGRQDLFDESMRLGHSAAWELQWDRAIEFYRKALAEFPDDANALTSLGLALFETEHLEDALLVYQKARHSEPENPIAAEKCAEIHEKLGDAHQAIEEREAAADLYVRQRNADKAIENWCHSARLDPSNLAVRSRLGLTYERLGRKREAAHEYLAVASILQRNRKADRAMEAVQMAVRLQPSDPEARTTLRALRQGRPLPAPSPPRNRTGPLSRKEVGAHLQSDTTPVMLDPEIVPDDPEAAAKKLALSMLAGMLFEEAADDELEVGQEDDSDITNLDSMSHRLGELSRSSGHSRRIKSLSLAIDLMTRNSNAQAAKEMKNAIDMGIEHPAAHYILGLLLKETQDLDNARQHLSVSIGHPELALGANLALGRITRTQGNLSEASRYLLQALRLADALSVSESQRATLNQLYDTILATQGIDDTDELSRIVENALEILSGPDWMKRVRDARNQLEHQGSDDFEPIANLLTVNRTNHVVRALERIDELAAQKFYNSAMEEALLGLQYAPNYLGIHLRIANILFSTGRKDACMKKLAVIAETHRVRGETVQATKIYTRMLKMAPVDVNARKRLISLLTQQDRTEEALNQYLELADLYRQMAEVEASRKALVQALELAQMSGGNRAWMTKILHSLGDMDLARLDWRRALRVYEQICNLDPNDTDARLQLIDLNLRLGQEKESGKALDAYLGYLAEHDRGAEIVNVLEELTREYPGKQILHKRLAEAYKAVGRTADAIAQYDALAEIQYDAKQVFEAIRTIETIISLNPPDLEGYQEVLRNLRSGH